ncbi:hypothetical protein A5789_09195 [Nocardia sp. 852002-51101_SCH5132738]|uniref:hypothetical protein n=1 Tax=Nocardia sp. 852002-51101_SCH5132738 TaxID=1834095 RepID=UPI0007E95ECE|nr:hypothetical protein [Nocardia sp. 852002-51101_SCH5132738]OBA44456.1 hypothetical protein A5789_09195 [Nocardia sp. 852002-51101_SCH5132738]
MNLRKLLTRHRNTPTPAAPAAPDLPSLHDDPLIDRRAHSLEMWCEDPQCEQCTDTGDGECLETAEIVNGKCSCGRWSCKDYGDLEVMGAFNAHLRQVQRAAHHQAARSGAR